MGGGTFAVLVIILGIGYLALQGTGILTVGGSTNVPTAKVKQFAQAISVAEGYGIGGAIPTEANNPGDLAWQGKSPYAGDTGQRMGNNIIVFDTPADGWNALYQQVTLMLSGNDVMYPLTNNLQQVGQTYADDPANWPANVSAQLNLPVTATLQDFLNGGVQSAAAICSPCGGSYCG